MIEPNTNYRMLLEEVLPTYLLEEPLQRVIEKSLESGDTVRLWKTAGMILETLVARGIFVHEESRDGVEIFHDRRGLLRVVLSPPERAAPDYTFPFRPFLPAGFATQGKSETLESVLTGVATRSSEEDLGVSLRKIAEYLNEALSPMQIRFISLTEDEPMPGLFDTWATSFPAKQFRDHFLEGGSPLYIPDLAMDPRFRDIAMQEGIRSVTILPLRAGEETYGLLEVHHTKIDPFGKEELGVLSFLALLAAGRIRNAHDLEKLIYIDILTGVFSRRFFEEQVLRELERANREEIPLALAIVDLDNFKMVNDRFGHIIGDAVLSDVARIFKDNVRKIDLVTRYGGEEFAILLPGASKEQTGVISERLRSLVEKLVIRENEDSGFQLTISIGVALHPEHSGMELEPRRARKELLQKADHALYNAKHSGKNRVVFYSE